MIDLTNDMENVHNIERYRKRKQKDDAPITTPTSTKPTNEKPFTSKARAPILDTMTITREEIDAKLQASESRLETRLVSMEANMGQHLQKISTAIDSLQNEATAQSKIVDNRLGGLEDKVKSVSDDAKEAKNAVNNLWWHLLAVGIAFAALAFAIYVFGVDLTFKLFGQINAS